MSVGQRVRLPGDDASRTNRKGSPTVFSGTLFLRNRHLLALMAVVSIAAGLLAVPK